MLSEKVLSALNDQLKYEFDSAHTYLAMAAYCEDQDFSGFANFFRAQAEEERTHAMKFFDFINDRRGRVKVQALEEPTYEYESITDAFQKAYEHEKDVTKKIYQLMDIATDEREHSTISFLKWFVDEQVEEEATFESLVKKVRLAENNNAALLMLDSELGKRQFGGEGA